MFSSGRVPWIATFFAIAFVLIGCGGDGDGTPTPGDTTPPSAISDLTGSGIADSTVRLIWTAPGDDGTSGTAAQYDIRYSSQPYSRASWWDSVAVVLLDPPTPATGGAAETLSVDSLLPETTYYFAIKAADEVPNWSDISNVPSATTLTEEVPPDAVDDLATGAVTDSSVLVTWTAPGDDGSTGQAAEYDLRYATTTITAGTWGAATAVTGEPAPSAAGSSDSVTVTGLTASTTYYFALKTKDDAGNWSDLSNVPSATTSAPPDVTPPAAVTDLATGAITDSSVALSWSAPGDDGSTGTATSYDIRYATSTITTETWDAATSATGEPTPGAAGTVEGYTVAGLAAGTTYYFALKASDEVPNASDLSNIASAQTTAPDQTAPAAVSDLATGAATITTMPLTWTAPGDDGSTGQAAVYDVRYATTTITEQTWSAASQAIGEPTPSTAGTAESFSVTDLTSSTTYYFALKTADDAGNWSDLSNVATGTTLTPLDETPPSAVGDLATGSVTDSSIALAWTAPGDDGSSGTATTYDIRYATSTITEETWSATTTATGEPTPSAAGTSESFSITGLDATTTYYFALKTADEAGNWSDLSNVASDTTTAAPDETAPAAVSDLAAGTATSTSVPLTWTAPGDDGSTGQATTYDVRYATSTITTGTWDAAAQASGEPAPATAGSSESFSVTGLDEDTTYYFAIKTADEVGNWSSISNVTSATTLLTDVIAPSAISDLTVGTVTDATVALSWTAPGDDASVGQATAYDLRYATSTINSGTWDAATRATGEPTPSSAGASETFTVTGLSENTTYYFAIKTSDEVPNTSDLSNVASTTTVRVTPGTFIIQPDGSGDYPDIATGIASGIDGDSLLLASGTFTGSNNKNIDFDGKEITIRSQSGDSTACIIDCQGSGRGFIFQSGESTTSRVEALTITDGAAGSDYGGAILCRDGAAPSITSCVLSSNSASRGGAVAFINGSAGVMSNCNLTGNTSTSQEGGGIYASLGGTLTVSYTSISNNTGGGIRALTYSGAARTGGTLTLTECTVNGNTLTSGDGGGIRAGDVNLTITGGKIQGNSASRGGGIYYTSSDWTPMTISHCLVTGNYASDTGGGMCLNAGGQADITNCTFSSNRAVNKAGGIRCGIGGLASTFVMTRSILYNNSGDPLEAGEAYGGGGSSSMTFNCCSVSAGGVDHEGYKVYETCAYAGPDHCGAADASTAPTTSGDYRLRSYSECAPDDPHNPCDVLIGALDVGC